LNHAEKMMKMMMEMQKKEIITQTRHAEAKKTVFSFFFPASTPAPRHYTLSLLLCSLSLSDKV
jgi:hypothetical protein